MSLARLSLLVGLIVALTHNMAWTQLSNSGRGTSFSSRTNFGARTNFGSAASFGSRTNLGNGTGFGAVTEFGTRTDFGSRTGFGRPVQVRFAAQIADLREQLEKGLRARRPEEFAFIARVVEFVESGQLSSQLVRETFQWARRKRPYPYPYFERAMRLRALHVGVLL
jgi:hypothetical protein